MEVIQNADDNLYSESVIPKLYITVTPHWVKIECNEKGFEEENIRALCRTGRSSKALGKGYIGEKGIGFKSVFKVGKTAHIRSPPYFFQLDVDRPLGMITPQWDEAFFEDHRQKHQTTIILDRICDESRDFATALETDLESLHPMVLLFLRQIKQLHLTLSHSRSPYLHPTIKKHFQCFNDALRPRITSLQDKDSGIVEHFYTIKSTVEFRGQERKRPDVTRTEIVLAFPVKRFNDIWTANPKDLPTFAYLPLGNFNFRVSLFDTKGTSVN
jgi:hypothetical protein